MAAVWGSAVRTRSSKGQQCLLDSHAPSNHPQPNTRVGRFTEDEKDHGWADATGKSSAPGGTSQPENWAHPDWAVWLLLASRLGPMSSVLSQDFRSVPHQLDVNMLGSKVLTRALLGTVFPKACAFGFLFPLASLYTGPLQAWLTGPW